jgi:hypothetical protein
MKCEFCGHVVEYAKIAQLPQGPELGKTFCPHCNLLRPVVVNPDFVNYSKSQSMIWRDEECKHIGALFVPNYIRTERG